MSSENNETLVGYINFTTAAGGGITATNRSWKAVAAAGGGNGRYLVNLTDAVANADLNAQMTVSSADNAAGGAALLWTLTRISDTQYEVGLQTATGVAFNLATAIVRVAFYKVDGTNG